MGNDQVLMGLGLSPCSVFRVVFQVRQLRNVGENCEAGGINYHGHRDTQGDRTYMYYLCRKYRKSRKRVCIEREFLFLDLFWVP